MRLLLLRAAVPLLLLAGVSGCSKVQAKTPPPMPLLDMPAPPGRLIVPTTLPEPTPEPTPAVTSAPPPTRPANTPATRPERPAPQPTPTPEATPPAAPPVLQTTSDPSELARNAQTQIQNARRDLQKVNYKGLNPDAVLQFDTAQQYIRQAEEALKVKNYLFASQLAEKAAVLASLLVKSQGRGPIAPTSF